MAASALHQTTSFLGTAPRRDDLVRSVGDFGGRITMRRTVKSAPQSIWYVLLLYSIRAMVISSLMYLHIVPSINE
jgi:hypothetical protein